MEQVILVDESDNEIGFEEKIKAHELALLHRAFSIFIFNNQNEMLLQQRALTKYHSAGLWTNACCSHPKPNETIEDAATRRLKEELGFTTTLTKAFNFIYQASFDNGLTEHELDYVFIGNYNNPILFNKEEVADYKFISIQKIEEEIKNNPQKFTAWFKIALPKVVEWLNKKTAI